MKSPAPQRSNRSKVNAEIAKAVHQNDAGDHLIFDGDGNACNDSYECPGEQDDTSNRERGSVLAMVGPGGDDTITTFEQLVEAFGIDYNRHKNMPSIKTRFDTKAGEILEDDPNGKRKVAAMVNVLVDVVEVASAAILPGNPDYLVEQALEQLDSNHCSGKRKAERETSEKIVQSLINLCRHMPHSSKGFQVSRAVLVSSGSQKNMQSVYSHLQPPKLGRVARSTARADFERMTKDGLDPTRKRRSVKKVKDDIVEEAVKDILSPSNVGCIAWSTRELSVPGTDEIIVFPGLPRRRSLEDMYRRFLERKKEDALMKATRVVTRGHAKQRSFLNCLSRGAYCSLASFLTVPQAQMTRSIDYCTDRYVNERFHVITRIIMDLVAPSQKAEMLRLLAVLQNFLKYQYDSHVTRDDDVSVESCMATMIASYTRFTSSAAVYSGVLAWN